MPHPAIVEAYAYATADIEVATVEVRHPELTDPGTEASGTLRLASVFAPPGEIDDAPFFEAKLEADAPVGPGQIVPFNRAPIEIMRPEKTSLGVPLARFRFSNVDAAITRALMAVSKTRHPVEATIRVFTMARGCRGSRRFWAGSSWSIRSSRREGSR